MAENGGEFDAAKYTEEPAECITSADVSTSVPVWNRQAFVSLTHLTAYHTLHLDAQLNMPYSLTHPKAQCTLQLITTLYMQLAAVQQACKSPSKAWSIYLFIRVLDAEGVHQSP
eukprot:scaffold115428_cov19-Tisochrysis_lutea.AAC.1